MHDEVVALQLLVVVHADRIEDLHGQQTLERVDAIVRTLRALVLLQIERDVVRSVLLSAQNLKTIERMVLEQTQIVSPRIQCLQFVELDQLVLASASVVVEELLLLLRVQQVDRAITTQLLQSLFI